MPLTTGTRLGPYEVIAAIGSGGMGEVYRARDTKLNRDVALKVLPDSFASDPDRLARFQREAQVLASLNHPNIAIIHGLEEADGIRALVLELVEGPTLAEVIATGTTQAPAAAATSESARRGAAASGGGAPRALSVDEALPIACQIAEALEAAHEQGIIHRDLKPANVKLRPDGTVKVLDFGLAKALAAGAGSEGQDPAYVLSQSPTITSPAATRMGVILGTAAYMSPEQARGKSVDKRSDIWAFGCVLYEILSGKRTFEAGETVSDAIAMILTREPDWNALPADTPAPIRELLKRCLDRDVKTRLRDIGEARVAIQKYVANPASAVETGATPSPGTGGRSRFALVAWGAWAVATVAVVCTAALAYVHFREQPPAAESVRFQIAPPEKTTFANTAVLSPDGRRLVFEAPGPDGRVLLWVRSLDSLDARPLAGTEAAAPAPFWSADSRFIAFGVNGFPGRLKKVDASGGPPQTLGDYSGGFREGAWTREGVILFGAVRSGLWQVSEAGGTPSPVTKVDPSRQEIQHAGPTFLPDGRQFLYHRGSRAAENHGIYLGSLDAKPEEQSTTRLLAADSDPVYVPASNSGGGYLLFLREGSLLAQPLDGRLELTGDAIPIAEDVGTLGSYGWFSASTTGGLAFRTGRAAAANTELLWFDRQGKRIGQVGPPADYGAAGIQLSPDGKKVVVARPASLTIGGVGTVQGSHVWTADLARAIFSRLNSGDAGEMAPAVSPDGRVAFGSTLNGAVGDLYWMPTSGVGAPEPLLLKSPTVKHPNHISLDGRYLIYDDHHPTQSQDLWILPLAAPPSDERKPIPFLVTQADETFGQFSPDGKWIAYSSDESGRREVYVQGFAPDRVPAVAVGKWQISTAGGDTPRWRRDGKELYYIATDRKMMAVPVKIGPAFEPGIAVPLFETRVTGFFAYDVSPDGRFLLNTVSESSTPNSSPITIVLNWRARVK